MRCVQQVTILEFSQRSVAQPSTRALKSCRSSKLKGRSQFVPGSWHEGGIYIVLSGRYLRDEQFWGRAVRASLIRKSQGRFSFLAQDKTQTSFPSRQALGNALHSRNKAITRRAFYWQNRDHGSATFA